MSEGSAFDISRRMAAKQTSSVGKDIVIDGGALAKLSRSVELLDDPASGQTLPPPERALARDEIAVVILKSRDGKRALDGIAAEFSDMFGAPRKAFLADMIAFIRAFSNRRMLEISR
ncbi:pyrroloquinoline quinone biosynthesis protein PqqD [Endobacterium cereale]|uniref:pyrroloquinoline quinone biosynthesis protein PqqD n=1 Tax=Endobacterium cereale TaxID=2663029 RepID=UPI002B4724B6|nr:pyrroloquinoline quinone biosynthesis protein PqqD [Endobacterium cereale]MEB2846285.1 pyrroloquinoline quinone biosynthesis protein PqqD [Endobacterium cereale]